MASCQSHTCSWQGDRPEAIIEEEEEEEEGGEEEEEKEEEEEEEEEEEGQLQVSPIPSLPAPATLHDHPDGELHLCAGHFGAARTPVYLLVS